MKLRIATLLFLGSVIASGHARADGNELLRACNLAVKSLDANEEVSKLVEAGQIGYCMGMMEGITHLNIVYQTAPKPRPLFCLPEKTGIENGQAARVVVQYLREHPKDLHKSAIFSAVRALRYAYPCKDD